MNENIGSWINGQVDGCMKERMKERMDRYMDEWMNGLIEGQRMNRGWKPRYWMDGWKEEQICINDA